MQTNPFYNQKSQFPQFERSPEGFPALTIYPDGWDMSELLPTNMIIPAELVEKLLSKENQPGERNKSA